MSELLNVDAALDLILRDFERLPSEIVPLSAALGRVLASDVIATEDMPPFAASAMDGFALHAADVVDASAESPVMLPVVMDIPAGSAPDRPLLTGAAARIMTGAPLPEGADAVIPVEDTDAAWRLGDDLTLGAQVGMRRAVSVGAHIRPVGQDVRVGQVVLEHGTRIRAAEWGVLAGLGQAQVEVVRQPRIAIMSGGDELLEPHEPLTPGKIRDMNSYTLAALVSEHGGIPIRIATARDSLADIRARFVEALAAAPDIILSSAGVSVGTADLIRTVLEEMGQVGFWKINLRPGKPLAYGKIQGVPFFGLPGNPVSAMVTFEVLVRPALHTLAGGSDILHYRKATAAEDIPSDGRRSYVRVRLYEDRDGRLMATTTGTQSSGAIMSMVLADGLLIMPEGMRLARAGEVFPVRLLR